MRGREATDTVADTKERFRLLILLMYHYGCLLCLHSAPHHLAKEQRRSVHSESHDDREKEHQVDREGAGMRPIPSPVLPFAFHRRLTLVVPLSAGVERQQNAQRARHETQRPHRVLHQDAQPEEQNRAETARKGAVQKTFKIFPFHLATPCSFTGGPSHRRFN